MEARAITWNLFHGRDHPPEPELLTWRSRLLRNTERGDAHAQVNRDLFEEFAATLAKAEWDVALLQESPPRWAEVIVSRFSDIGGRPPGQVAGHFRDLGVLWSS